jgi:hypothetical protein
MAVPSSLQVLFELSVAGFSAVFGAAALLWLQSKIERARYLRALQSEFERNLSRSEEVEKHLEMADSKGEIDYPRFHSEVFDAIRVDDPILYIELIEEIRLIERTYRRIDDLSRLNEPKFEADMSKEELLSLYSGGSKLLQQQLEEIRNKRNHSLISRFLGDNRSVRTKIESIEGAIVHKRDRN